MYEIDSATVVFLVKVVLFRENNFICSGGVNKLVIRYFKFFEGLTKIVVNQLMIVQLYSYIIISEEINLNEYSFSFNLGELRNSI